MLCVEEFLFQSEATARKGGKEDGDGDEHEDSIDKAFWELKDYFRFLNPF